MLDPGPVAGVEHRALPGQPGAHVAHLPAAHRVGLAGQRERPGPGAADRAGGQVQVDQGVGVPGAVRGLVEAHRPRAHPAAAGLADPLGRPPQVGLVQPGDPRHVSGLIVLEEAGHRVPALGVLGDELRVDGAAHEQQLQQTIEKGQIGARLDLKEQVRLRRRGGAARVDDDQPCGTRPDPVHHAQEQDRMAVGHVRADDEEELGVIEVLVGSGRPVGAE